jgi:hypothetical protein
VLRATSIAERFTIVVSTLRVRIANIIPVPTGPSPSRTVVVPFRVRLKPVGRRAGLSATRREPYAVGGRSQERVDCAGDSKTAAGPVVRPGGPAHGTRRLGRLPDSQPCRPVAIAGRSPAATPLAGCSRGGCESRSRPVLQTLTLTATVTRIHLVACWCHGTTPTTVTSAQPRLRMP